MESEILLGRRGIGRRGIGRRGIGRRGIGWLSHDAGDEGVVDVDKDRAVDDDHARECVHHLPDVARVLAGIPNLVEERGVGGGARERALEEELAEVLLAAIITRAMRRGGRRQVRKGKLT